jgi:hypothetical protein
VQQGDPGSYYQSADLEPPLVHGLFVPVCIAVPVITTIREDVIVMLLLLPTLVRLLLFLYSES